MLDEITIHLFSQLAYLDPPPKTGPTPAVGDVAAYYLKDPVGSAYLEARFGSIPLEYAGWLAFLREGIDPVRDWRIVNVMDRNRKRQSGFYACSYLSPRGELAAAFRGSEMLGNRHYRNDYETDFALAYDTATPQQRAAEEYLRGFGDFQHHDYYLTGHSLGGNLALHGAVHAPSAHRIIGCYAFNAPGFNGDYIRLNKKRIKEVRPKLHAFQNEHDIVSSLLIGIAKPFIASSLFAPEAQEESDVSVLLYPHSNFMFRKENGRFIPNADGRKDSLCGRVNRLTRLFLLLPDAVKEAISGMALDAIYSSQPPEKQLSFLLEQATKYMVRNQVPDLGSGGLAASSVLYAAKHAATSNQSAMALYHGILGRSDEEKSNLAPACVLLFQLLQSGCLGASFGRQSA